MKKNINAEAADPRKALLLQNPSPSQTTPSAMPLEMLIKIFSHLGVSSAHNVFRCKTVNKVINKACDSKEIYEHMEVDSFFTVRFGMLSQHREPKEEILKRCRKEKNPNLMFREAMVQYFIAGNSSGKDAIEKASKLGQSDAIFVEGMLMMVEGNHGKQEALKLLNDGYRKSGRNWNISAKLEKFHRVLNRGQVRPLEFHGCYKTCQIHHDPRLLSRASMHFQSEWLTDCPVCLWEATFMAFGRIFGKEWWYINLAGVGVIFL